MSILIKTLRGRSIFVYPYILGIYFIKDIISIDEETANAQRSIQIGTNYEPYWMKQ